MTPTPTINLPHLQAELRGGDPGLPSRAGMTGELRNRVITPFGADFATADVEFLRDGDPLGRQSQAWVRFPAGWRVVSAHRSMLA